MEDGCFSAHSLGGAPGHSLFFFQPHPLPPRQNPAAFFPAVLLLPRSSPSPGQRAPINLSQHAALLQRVGLAAAGCPPPTPHPPHHHPPPFGLLMSQCSLSASIGFEVSAPGTVPGTCRALNQCLQNRILGGAGVHREQAVRGAGAARGPRGRAPPLRARAAPPPARAAPTPRAAAGRGRWRRSQRRPRLAAPARLRVTDPRSRRGEVRSGARHTRHPCTARGGPGTRPSSVRQPRGPPSPAGAQFPARGPLRRSAFAHPVRPASSRASPHPLTPPPSLPPPSPLPRGFLLPRLEAHEVCPPDSFRKLLESGEGVRGPQLEAAKG